MNTIRFVAQHGTVFVYQSDLEGEILVQLDREKTETTGRVSYRGNIVLTVNIPADDLLEFACHLAGMPPWDPARDEYDAETSRLMLRHLDTCDHCQPVHCEEYWKLILDRVKEKERRAIH